MIPALQASLPLFSVPPAPLPAAAVLPASDATQALLSAGVPSTLPSFVPAKPLPPPIVMPQPLLLPAVSVLLPPAADALPALPPAEAPAEPQLLSLPHALLKFHAEIGRAHV